MKYTKKVWLQQQIFLKKIFDFLQNKTQQEVDKGSKVTQGVILV